MQTARLTLSALLIAIGTLTANLFYIPAGISKCFPVQHCINVLAAILLGPSYATGIGFTIALLRNMFGPVFAQEEVLLRGYPAMLRKARRLGWR